MKKIAYNKNATIRNLVFFKASHKLNIKLTDIIVVGLYLLSVYKSRWLFM